MRPNSGLDKVMEEVAVAFWVCVESGELRGCAERLNMGRERE